MSQENHEIQVNLRLKGELAAKIKAIAEAEDRAYTYIIKRLVKEGVEGVANE